MATPQDMLDPDEAVFVLKDLLDEWNDLRPRFDLMDLYYSGNHPLYPRPEHLQRKHAAMVGMSVSNWSRLIVDVVAERLVVGGIRASDQESAQRLWRMWDYNGMDDASARVHVESLKYGLGYVSAWPGPDGKAQVRGESPLQVHVRYSDDEAVGAETDTALAAVKLWQRRDNSVCATVYLPDYVYRFVATDNVKPSTETRFTTSTAVTQDITRLTWRPRLEMEDDEAVSPNPTGAVPFVAFYCQPNLVGGYTGEIEPVIPIQDRINKTTFDRLVSQEFTAFPQRYATGIEIPKDPETGKPVAPFTSGPDRLWATTRPDAKFGQFDASGTDPYLDAITADIQALATQSRTPPHYFMAGMGRFPSGESVRATEYGLSRKVTSRQQSFGVGWVEVMRRAATIEKDPAADDEALKVIWADVEARSEGETVDALLKMATLGVPKQVLWQRWGASPEDVSVWLELAEKEAEIATGLLPAGIQPGVGLRYGTEGRPEDRVEVETPQVSGAPVGPVDTA